MIVALADQNLGMAVGLGGRLADGEAIERRALAFFSTTGDIWMTTACRTYLAWLLAARGHHDDALAEARRAVDDSASQRLSVGAALAMLAHVELAAGNAGAALDAATRGMAILDATGVLDDWEALLRLVYAQALDATGRTEDARAAMRAARDRLAVRAADLRSDMRGNFLDRVPENARTIALATAWGV
jgi:hypothetical protein